MISKNNYNNYIKYKTKYLLIQDGGKWWFSKSELGSNVEELTTFLINLAKLLNLYIIYKFIYKTIEVNNCYHIIYKEKKIIVIKWDDSYCGDDELSDGVKANRGYSYMELKDIYSLLDKDIINIKSNIITYIYINILSNSDYPITNYPTTDLEKFKKELKDLILKNTDKVKSLTDKINILNKNNKHLQNLSLQIGNGKRIEYIP
jgi:hypothetical protein